jgi:hypothetical protein
MARHDENAVAERQTQRFRAQQPSPMCSSPEKSVRRQGNVIDTLDANQLRFANADSLCDGHQILGQRNPECCYVVRLELRPRNRVWQELKKRRQVHVNSASREVDFI